MGGYIAIQNAFKVAFLLTQGLAVNLHIEQVVVFEKIVAIHNGGLHGGAVLALDAHIGVASLRQTVVGERAEGQRVAQALVVVDVLADVNHEVVAQKLLKQVHNRFRGIFLAIERAYLVVAEIEIVAVAVHLAQDVVVALIYNIRRAVGWQSHGNAVLHLLLVRFAVFHELLVEIGVAFLLVHSAYQMKILGKRHFAAIP